MSKVNISDKSKKKPSTRQARLIYLDNNATTRASDATKQIMTDWIQSCSNPSSGSWLAGVSRKMIEETEKTITKLCHLQGYYITFTSGASESNCSILHMTVDAWYRAAGSAPGAKPHIVSSSIEHKSILDCLTGMTQSGKIDLTLIEPDLRGIVDPLAVEAAIKPTTILITIMYANNETGSIQPIAEIAKIASKREVPLHTDAVQMFGKKAIDLPGEGIDALSMSAHKIYGPCGVGLLILRKAFVDGYNLSALVSGTQQHGLRGGTENVSGIAGLGAAILDNFQNRRAKNAKLAKLRTTLVELLSKRFPIVDFKDLADGDLAEWTKPTSICLLGPLTGDSVLPSTLLISILKRDFCNVKFKKALEAQGVIVSIGSACNTNASKASHVLTAIRAPPIVKKGVLRISIGDYNSPDDIRDFFRIFESLLS